MGGIFSISGSSAAVTPGPMLIVNEHVLHSLPYEQQRFLLGHEAMHIKHHHFLKKLEIGVILSLLQAGIHYNFESFYTRFLDKLSEGKLKKMLQSDTAKGTVRAVIFITTFLVPLIGYGWMLELEATCEGTKALNAIHGALDYLVENSCDHTASVGSKIRQGIPWLVRRLYHPPISWHAAKVEKLLSQ